jgi:RNA polymerase sigma-70 factor (ECF subfamily)
VSAEEDTADVARVLAGEVSAFEAIVRRWQTPLVNLAYRYCRDRARAEDMAQEAFLRAYRSLASWRKEAAFDRRATAPIIDEERRDRVIRNAVLALPAKYRDALTLFYFHGMDIARSAASLGVPEGTVKARLSRGRDILRSKLPSLLRNP